MLFDDRIKAYFENKTVLVTGHTGFKGSWLCLSLIELGAQVTGLALEARNPQNLFNACRLEDKIDHHIIDIRDQDNLELLVHKIQPDIIFHLAAQALVIDSYQDPYSTLSTNVTGTLNLFEATRKLNKSVTLVNITTDKCYLNNNTGEDFKENDPLGGKDIYSASKAMVEIMHSAYRESFFKDTNIKAATVRAGNVIGGGDWSKNRLVPDFIR